MAAYQASASARVCHIFKLTIPLLARTRRSLYNTARPPDGASTDGSQSIWERVVCDKGRLGAIF